MKPAVGRSFFCSCSSDLDRYQSSGSNRIFGSRQGGRLDHPFYRLPRTVYCLILIGHCAVITTASASSSVVMPLTTLSAASCLRVVIMPEETASRAISCADTFLRIIACIFSSFTRTSKMPVLPLYPVLRHCWHPLPCIKTGSFTRSRPQEARAFGGGEYFSLQ